MEFFAFDASAGRTTGIVFAILGFVALVAGSIFCCFRMGYLKKCLRR
jgi:hypothetical protein